MPSQQYEIPKTSDDMYQNKPSSNPLGNEDIYSYTTSKPITYEPYPLLHIDGASFPMKGWYEPNIIAELNIIKSLILHTAHFPLSVVVANKQKLIATFNQLYDKIFHYTLNQSYLLPATRGFYQFLTTFLTTIGIPNLLAAQFAFRIAHIIQYDDAYRYRLQDILSETTHKKLIDKPITELYRLIKILDARTPKGNQVANKLKRILVPATLLLLLPKYRKAFRNAMSKDVLKDMQYDEADRYWACLKNEDYLFTGKDYQTRTKGLQIPKMVKVVY